MSTLLDFALSNFTRLQPADYVLIAVLVFLVSAGIFAVFRWLYGALLRAQAQLIQTKDSTIAEYERSLAVTRRTHDSTQQEVNRLNERVTRLVEAYRQVEQDRTILEDSARRARQNALVLLVVSARSRMAYLQLRVFCTVQDMLASYMGMEIERIVPEAPEALTLAEELGRIMERLKEAEREIFAFSEPISPQTLTSATLQLPAALAVSGNADHMRDLDVVFETLRTYIQRAESTLRD